MVNNQVHAISTISYIMWLSKVRYMATVEDDPFEFRILSFKVKYII